MQAGYCYYCGKEHPLRSLKVDADPIVSHIEDCDDEDYEPPEDRWRHICSKCIPKRREMGVTWICGPENWRAYNGPQSYSSIYGS